MEATNAAKRVASQEFAVKVGKGVSGYMVPFILRNFLDSKFDAPDELYGLTAAAGGMYLGEPEFALGAGINAAEKGAERVGIRSTIVNVGN